jgi:hypothetical protein
MADNEKTFLEDKAVGLADTADSTGSDSAESKIIPFIMEKYQKAEDYRKQDEQRWLRAYRNYRGLYSSDVQFTEAEKSRVFIKVTKTKTLAAYGQIVDVLFANNAFPITIDPTELPDGVIADVHFDPKMPKELVDREEEVSPYGYREDGKKLPAGATGRSLAESLGPLSKVLRWH